MPWPPGPSQHLHLRFSHFVSLGCELFTTIGKLVNPGGGIHSFPLRTGLEHAESDVEM